MKLPAFILSKNKNGTVLVAIKTLTGWKDLGLYPDKESALSDAKRHLWLHDPDITIEHYDIDGNLLG